MKALFIQQDHASPLGPIGERVDRRGYDIVQFQVVPEGAYLAPDVAVRFPDPLEFDLIVPMGAVWSVNDQGGIGWIAEELALLRTAHGAGVPILGICFGGQSLAAALGGAVERSPQAELGWTDIGTDDESLIEPGPWFQWHGDRWTLPPGAQELARTPIASQAFSLGRSMGLQFHPEVVPDTLLAWYPNGTEYLTAHGVDPDQLMERTKREEPGAIARAHRLVDRFLERVASRPLEAG